MTSTSSVNSMFLDEATLCARASGMPPERVKELADFARQRGEALVRVLIDRGGADERQLLEGLAGLLKVEFLGSIDDAVNREVAHTISPALAIRHNVMPLGEVDGRVRMACSDPFNWQQWDDLCQLVGRPLSRVLCPHADIVRMLKEHYGLGAETVERLVSSKSAVDAPTQRFVTTRLSDEEAANEPTVVNLVNRILSAAIEADATDIHFEAHENRYRIRYRIDGMLEDVAMPASVNMLRLAVVSRIKIMANLDITEKRLPQDGRCQVSLQNKDYDLRVSILPGVHGESIVIRLQKRGMVRMELQMLGYTAEAQEKISELINRPNGLILVTGPTGSGKTTTLYTCLGKINHPDTKIITIEDPVEYWMENILQMQVQENIGFNFAHALRGMLRHDPDVMLVGEIRDRETADIAIRASLTGHLVFATLHTNDAAGAVSRLLDLSIEPFLLAGSLRGIIAQRLVRKVCESCRQQVSNESVEGIERKLFDVDADWRSMTLWQGAGCERCRFTGYRGRTAIAEVLLVTPAVRTMIQQRQPSDQIRQTAIREGMNTLIRSGIEAIGAGKTSVAEVYRATQEDT